MLGLRGEERPIASPTVYEDEGRLASTAIPKRQLDAVVHHCGHPISPFSRDKSTLTPISFCGSQVDLVAGQNLAQSRRCFLSR
jgi:hypothetical protein